MEASGFGTTSNVDGSYAQPSSFSFFQSPLAVVLEHLGIPPTISDEEEEDEVRLIVPHSSSGNGIGANEDVHMRITGAEESEERDDISERIVQINEFHAGEEAGVPLRSPPSVDDFELGDIVDNNGSESSYRSRRYDVQHIGRLVEQILPFSLLMLFIFIRQHLQGFSVMMWIVVVTFKSNDIIRKQTSLKNRRNASVLISISIIFIVHIAGVYWWFWNDGLLYPLVMVPPEEILPFWHAVFIIMVNDTMVRQVAMTLKSLLLICYKNGKGQGFCWQGQILALVEYTVLLYRALLPAPVWYRFFLNKNYGSLFSSLTTGLYLTLKLTSIVEKVQSFLSALKALSNKEFHCGTYATPEQVNMAGGLCAICQESIHAAVVLLGCKHVFCEDCLSQWFERERTCPLCRAVIKPANLLAFGDGSTSLSFQLF